MVGKSKSASERIRVGKRKYKETSEHTSEAREDQSKSPDETIDGGEEFCLHFPKVCTPMIIPAGNATPYILHLRVSQNTRY